MKTAKPQNKKGVIQRETEWWRFTKAILSFSHIWVCLVIAASAVLMLFCFMAFQRCTAVLVFYLYEHFCRTGYRFGYLPDRRSKANINRADAIEKRMAPESDRTAEGVLE